MKRAAYHSDFLPGDRVVIDNDREAHAIVTGLLFDEDSHEVRVSWWHNGALNTVWVKPSRLTRIEVRVARL